MAEELNWSKDEKERQIKMATDFLNLEMGLAVNKSMKEKTPVNLSPDEVQKYKKRFEVIDKEKKGMISICLNFFSRLRRLLINSNFIGRICIFDRYKTSFEEFR